MQQASDRPWLALSKRLLIVVPALSVPDAGCRDGCFLGRIDALIKAAVDLGPCPRGKQHYPVIPANRLHLPFKPGSFDAVAGLNVLDHIGDDQTLLNAPIGAARAGGRAWLSIGCPGLTLFSTFPTSRSQPAPGHVRRGHTLHGLTGNLPRSVQAAAGYCSKPFFRLVYMRSRLMLPVSTMLGRWSSAWCARLGSEVQYGRRGHLHLEVANVPPSSPSTPTPRWPL
jgi:hypothetical protein